MSAPAVIVEIGFTATSSEDYWHIGDSTRGRIGTAAVGPDEFWTDVTTYVKNGSTSRGASRVEGPALRYEAGRCTVLLDNRDRRFDPTNLGSNVGLVVGDSASPTAWDTELADRIAGRGYRVTYIDDSAAASTDYDCFVIAESVDATVVGTAYDTVAVPVVVAEHLLWDDMRLSANTGASTSADLTYDLESHSITSGMADPLTILTSATAQRGVLASALSAVSASVFARPGADATRAAGWTVETGGNLTSGTAPARRVAFFWPAAYATLVTDAGWTLFDAVLDWALDDAALSAPYMVAGVTQVTPMRPVRIRALHNGVTYAVFRGFADEWKLGYEEPSYGFVTLTATDATKIMTAYDRAAVASVGAGEDTGARVDRILDSAEWPDADRVVAVGDSTLQATTLSGPAWTEALEAQDAELGELYFDESGRAFFRNRLAILEDDRSNTSQATWGDGGGSELPYRDSTPEYDDSTLINVARVTRDGGAEQTASDATSISDYLTHVYERSGLPLESDAVALQYAAHIVHAFKDPELRFSSISIGRHANSATEDLIFAQALGRRIGDRITTKRRPPGGGVISQDAWIRGVRHTFGPMTWDTVWTLQAVTVAQFWTIGHPELGAVGTVNAIAY